MPDPRVTRAGLLLALSLAACAWGGLACAPSPEKNPYPLQTNPMAGCSICHVDVEDVFVGSAHFKSKIGCKTCHGPSKEHLADENNEVKPDRLPTRKDMDSFCSTCHDCSRPEMENPSARICTDCHGHHNPARVPSR